VFECVFHIVVFLLCVFEFTVSILCMRTKQTSVFQR
jgi:hypothetical protein